MPIVDWISLDEGSSGDQELPPEDVIIDVLDPEEESVHWTNTHSEYYDGFNYTITEERNGTVEWYWDVTDSAGTSMASGMTLSSSTAVSAARDWIDSQSGGQNGASEEDDVADVDSGPFPIDPSNPGDALDVIQSDEEPSGIWTDVPIPNWDSSPSLFQSFTHAGNVSINKRVLDAISDGVRGEGSEFFVRIANGTRVTFSVRLQYNNRAHDDYAEPDDWTEEFDVIMEGGDSMKWDVPAQAVSGTFGTIGWREGGRSGTFSIIIDGHERIDQTPGIFITYFNSTFGVQSGEGTQGVRARMSCEVVITRVESYSGEVIHEDDGDFTPTPIIDPEWREVFTGNRLLGFMTMGLLAWFVVDRISTPRPMPGAS